jgi:hypothetical protein
VVVRVVVVRVVAVRVVAVRVVAVRAIAVVALVVVLPVCHHLWSLQVVDRCHVGAKEPPAAAEEEVREVIQAVRRILSKICDRTDLKLTSTPAI